MKMKFMRNIRQKIKNEIGTTLIEVIMTAAILPMALGVAYFVMNQSYSTWKLSDHKAEALASSRYLIDRLSKDLRQAERPLVSIDTVNNNSISFKANINSQPGSEIIQYSLQSYNAYGGKIVRSVYNPRFVDNNPLKPYYLNQPDSQETLAKIIRNNLVSPKIPLFTYTKADGLPFEAGDDITLIRMINVDLLITSEEEDGSVDYKEAVRVNDSVRLRNF